MPYIDSYGVERPTIGELIKLIAVGNIVKLYSHGGAQYQYRMHEGEIEEKACDGNFNPYYQEWKRCDHISMQLATKLEIDTKQ